MTTPHAEAEQHVRTALHTYCCSFDNGDFEAAAALFQRGQWFGATKPGPAPVLAWIKDHVIVHEGRPRTRHEVSNLLVSTSDNHADLAQFSCYISIWQYMPAGPPLLLSHARFSGTFRAYDDGWWWEKHDMAVDYAGDVTAHLLGGAAALAPAPSMD